MLGFGKKKKKETIENKATDVSDPKSPEKKSKGKDAQGKESAPEMNGVQKPALVKKKLITPKRILLFFLIPGAVTALSFLAYSLVFQEKDPEKSVYEKIDLAHVNLPPEMLKFCFENFPDLYAALKSFDQEMTLFDGEIAWIQEIAQKYPEQQKITEAEKKIWEKGKADLLKEFSRLETPIREIYVLFQVNVAQGLARIKEKETELTDMARTALKAAQEQTEKINAREPEPPQGLFQGLLHQLKKKFQ